jgi:hypothetical protein
MHKGGMEDGWRTENGGIAYVNECDGNDSTRRRGENTWTDVNTDWFGELKSKTKRG